MINQIHPASVIGIKKLSEPDLGTKLSSNQTHIGLYENTLNFIDSEHEVISSQLIYDDRAIELLSLLDYIQNPDGTFRSPKIRLGSENELYINGNFINSVVREIRGIVQNINPNGDWFLLWLGLDTEELVFLLFESDSADFDNINQIVDGIGSSKRIANNQPAFASLVDFLNSKINTLNLEYYEELEIASQVGQEAISKRRILRARDIEKANLLFKKTGLKGEELLNEYFELQKSNSLIKDFLWKNKSSETGYPYDFEITNLDDSVTFSDAKSTRYKFELPIVLSNSEISFISEHRENYQIHRLYDIEIEPKMKVCNNIANVSDIVLPNLGVFNTNIAESGLSLRNLSLTVPTIGEIIEFGNTINLNANA